MGILGKDKTMGNVQKHNISIISIVLIYLATWDKRGLKFESPNYFCERNVSPTFGVATF
jgi:altronate dehydratase